MDKKKFAKGVERLIHPMDVGSLHFIQQFNKYLPRFLQDYFVKSSSKQYPHMGFVVEPYSSFLCYEILDLEKAKSLLPEGFELVKCKIFDDDQPKYYCIFGCIRAHTSAFWGARVEFYIMAEDKSTGLLSWIIVDYDSNTISYDKKNGLKSPNCSNAVVTINHKGTIYVDFERDDKSRRLAYEYNVESGVNKPLDQRLWLEGNLSIGYGKEASTGSADIFSLKFDPDEVDKALRIPVENVTFEVNNWMPGLFANTPSEVVCFPYAQHFVSDSPGYSSNLKNEQELVEQSSKLDFDNMKVFSTATFKTMIMVGSMISIISTTILLILLFLK